MNRLQEIVMSGCRMAWILCVLCVLPQSAWTQDSADGKSDSDSEKEAREPLFVVPEGSPQELFAFIERVKRTRPQATKREDLIAHVRLQIQAVLDACDRIISSGADEASELRAINEKLTTLAALQRYAPESATEQLAACMKALEADPRPAIVRLLAMKELEQRIARLSSLSESEQDAVVDQLFGLIGDAGLDRTQYTLASGLGRRLQYLERSEAAAALFERLAEKMETSDDAALSARVERTRGAARMARLPGNFMQIQGTTAQGEVFNWDSYRGKVVLVDFWASWCGPCRAEIPNMKAQLEKYGDRGFAIVGVNLDTSREKYQKYVDDQGLTWTNLMSDREEEMGWDHPLALHYGISGIPTAILVDQEGKVVSMSARGQSLNQELEKLLGPVEETKSSE